MTTRAAKAPRIASPAMKATRRRENIAAYIFMAPSLLFFLQWGKKTHYILWVKVFLVFMRNCDGSLWTYRW